MNPHLTNPPSARLELSVPTIIGASGFTVSDSGARASAQTASDVLSLQVTFATMLSESWIEAFSFG